MDKVALFEAMGIQSAPLLPLWQLGVLMRLKDTAGYFFPLMIQWCVAVGLVFTCLEAVRPSEDGKNTNTQWGTVVGGVLGIACFFLANAYIPAREWTALIAVLIAISAALVVASLASNERLMQVVTIKWGVRTIFDAPMLTLAFLVAFQMLFGVVGF